MDGRARPALLAVALLWPRVRDASLHASTRRSPPRSPTSPCASWRPRGWSSTTRRRTATRRSGSSRRLDRLRRAAATQSLLVDPAPEGPRLPDHRELRQRLRPAAGRRAPAADGARPPLHDRVLQPPRDRHQPRGRRLVPRGGALRAVPGGRRALVLPEPRLRRPARPEHLHRVVLPRGARDLLRGSPRPEHRPATQPHLARALRVRGRAPQGRHPLRGSLLRPAGAPPLRAATTWWGCTSSSGSPAATARTSSGPSSTCRAELDPGPRRVASASCGSTARAPASWSTSGRESLRHSGPWRERPRAAEGPRPRLGYFARLASAPDGTLAAITAGLDSVPELRIHNPDGSVRLRRALTNFCPAGRTSPPARTR